MPGSVAQRFCPATIEGLDEDGSHAGNAVNLFVEPLFDNEMKMAPQLFPEAHCGGRLPVRFVQERTYLIADAQDKRGVRTVRQEFGGTLSEELLLAIPRKLRNLHPVIQHGALLKGNKLYLAGGMSARKLKPGMKSRDHQFVLNKKELAGILCSDRTSVVFFAVVADAFIDVGANCVAGADEEIQRLSAVEEIYELGVLADLETIDRSSVVEVVEVLGRRPGIAADQMHNKRRRQEPVCRDVVDNGKAPGCDQASWQPFRLPAETRGSFLHNGGVCFFVAGCSFCHHGNRIRLEKFPPNLHEISA